MKTITNFTLLTLALFVAPPMSAQDAPKSVTLFSNVRIFDGKSAALSGPMNVLVRGNKIEKISTQPIPTDRRAGTTLIDGGGRTLMPGLIDAHTHVMYTTVPQMALLTADVGFMNVAAAKAANEMLLRGFTSA